MMVNDDDVEGVDAAGTNEGLLQTLETYTWNSVLVLSKQNESGHTYDAYRYGSFLRRQAAPHNLRMPSSRDEKPVLSGRKGASGGRNRLPSCMAGRT
jgi:hypothetical protein